MPCSSISPIFSLPVYLGVEIHIMKNDSVCACQVQALPSCSAAQQEGEDAIWLVVEPTLSGKSWGTLPGALVLRKLGHIKEWPSKLQEPWYEGPTRVGIWYFLAVLKTQWADGENEDWWLRAWFLSWMLNRDDRTELVIWKLQIRLGLQQGTYRSTVVSRSATAVFPSSRQYGNCSICISLSRMSKTMVHWLNMSGLLPFACTFQPHSYDQQWGGLDGLLPLSPSQSARRCKARITHIVKPIGCIDCDMKATCTCELPFDLRIKSATARKAVYMHGTFLCSMHLWLMAVESATGKLSMGWRSIGYIADRCPTMPNEEVIEFQGRWKGDLEFRQDLCKHATLRRVEDATVWKQKLLKCSSILLSKKVNLEIRVAS